MSLTVSSEDHKKLADVIKGVHQNLRKALVSSGDHNKVWTDHLKETATRKQYSTAMYKLATEAWKGKESRIDWTYKTCLDYFYNGGLERSITRQKKLKINLQKQNQELNESEYCDCLLQNNYENLKLLDVGSCYNPFSNFKEFCCIAIDLTPATEDVVQCDFLEADVKPYFEGCFSSNKLVSGIFYEKSFDIVVLSLVLEYLPAPQQRAKFCFKSWQLLQLNGLCIIITPDSKSVNHNAHMMKSWKLALEKIGFIRVKYEKLQHLHCMAFRKVRSKSISLNDVQQCESICYLLFIPQDFRDYSEKEDVFDRTDEENICIHTNFLELPNEDLF